MRRLQTATATAVIAWVGYAAHAYQTGVDEAEANDYRATVQTLLALDFRISAEVLRARSGAVAHYDGLVQTDAALRRIHARLDAMPAFLDAHARQEIGEQLRHAHQLSQQRAKLVETFKSDHAVLRNSLRYLSVLTAEIDAAQSGASETTSVRAELDTLVRDELLLQGWHDPTILTRVSATLLALAEGVREVKPSERERVDAALRHANLARERTASVNAVTRKIIEQPSVTHAQKVRDTYERHLAESLQREQAKRTALFALAMVALGLASASVITQLTRSARALRLAGEQLAVANGALRAEQSRQQELNELKSRFVSMTSHEFRTPLSTILSSSDLLEAYSDRWSAEKRREHFVRIRDAVTGMTRMLDGILMIGRSDSGMLAFQPKAVDLVRVCAAAIEAASTATHAEHEISYEGPSDAEPVMADEALLRHVLDNLLSNAIKYSPQGGPVKLQVTREGDQVCFEISDRGIGIPEADQATLFDTFKRGTNVGGIEGSGIGLAVVKRAVTLHGGVLTLRSKVGEGTTFQVRVSCPRTQA